MKLDERTKEDFKKGLVNGSIIVSIFVLAIGGLVMVMTGVFFPGLISVLLIPLGIGCWILMCGITNVALNR